MIVREVLEKEKAAYNKTVSHIIQSWEWGEFRKKTGLDLVRLGHFQGSKMVSAYQLTFHLVPIFNQNVGYLPKGPLPDEAMIKALFDIGKKKNIAYIKIEPNVINDKSQVISDKLKKLGLVPSKKSLFTKYNFLLDLNKSEEQLLSAMHPKTRYNISVAQKKGVEVYASTNDRDFEVYLKLYFETTKRQKYFGHTHAYHKLVWQTLKEAGMARVAIAKYQNKPLVAWMLLNFGNTLYYPYGGSSVENREVMASNLIAWEAIKLGKKLGLEMFDMWGALGPDADLTDPWFGFHRFKAGYGPTHVEYVGTYDLVLKPQLYNLLNIADKARWMFLRATRR
ncbi:MAG: peptidoglycan bridge formation glycyltransferase FemA/FemB family protein [Candidatus Curtissbacteria bacterium]|nr:peptidoglycan bridge formation glycyltransferase FemA/FemB family protein [Candidatus Curtissbacteria bacterium]